MYLIDAIKTVLLILVNISQIDIALWGVTVSETASLFTIRMLLNEKEFKNDNNKQKDHLMTGLIDDNDDNNSEVSL